MRLSVLTLLLLGCSGTSGSVLATNDMMIGVDLTPPSDLYGLGPAAVIFHPGDGTIYTVGASIPFVGHATDPTDGALTGNALVWRSNLVASPIGTGEMFSTTLPAGTHLITLTATDSKQLSDSKSLTVIVN
jgi:hypothetical protein